MKVTSWSGQASSPTNSKMLYVSSKMLANAKDVVHNLHNLNQPSVYPSHAKPIVAWASASPHLAARGSLHKPPGSKKCRNTTYNIIKCEPLAVHFPSPGGAESVEILPISSNLSRSRFTSQAPGQPKVWNNTYIIKAEPLMVHFTSRREPKLRKY